MFNNFLKLSGLKRFYGTRRWATKDHKVQKKCTEYKEPVHYTHGIFAARENKQKLKKYFRLSWIKKGFGCAKMHAALVVCEYSIDEFTVWNLSWNIISWASIREYA